MNFEKLITSIEYNENKKKFILNSDLPEYNEIKNYFEFNTKLDALNALQIWKKEINKLKIDSNDIEWLISFLRIKYMTNISNFVDVKKLRGMKM
jgi:hypothetical protein